jgi:hypothetical protein
MCRILVLLYPLDRKQFFKLIISIFVNVSSSFKCNQITKFWSIILLDHDNELLDGLMGRNLRNCHEQLKNVKGQWNASGRLKGCAAYWQQLMFCLVRFLKWESRSKDFSVLSSSTTNSVWYLTQTFLKNKKALALQCNFCKTIAVTTKQYLCTSKTG